MSKRSIHFPIVFHFHQPVDNFKWVYDESYEKAYRPLMEKIYEHPKVKFTLHFTGSLLEWLLDEKPIFKRMLMESVKRGQVEIIGGGYYEPIFAIIPERDQISQMKMLEKAVQEKLGYKVRGAWLSERVWEPNYPSFLKKAGLEYVIVDDNHLRGCGLTEEETFYSYTTEDSGRVIRVFEINEQIRYLTPWKSAVRAINYVEKNADEKGDRLIVFLSDAEKMGVWGTTNKLCYKEGHPEDDDVPYIEALFEGIEKSEIIESITLSEYIDEHKSKGLIYFPTATYDKMEEWVLPTKIRKQMEELAEDMEEEEKDEVQRKYPPYLRRFIKGGFWRYFLVKYPESNNMHKKMLYVRQRLLEVEEDLKDNSQGQEIRNESLLEPIRNAWDEIYRAQCNDCYWHGQFGGIYLHFLRHAVYKHLIKTEKIMDKLEERANLKADIFIKSIDFDKDSNKEIIISTDRLWLGLKPSDGGTLFELDYKPRSYNLLNTLTRWYEAYHEKEEVALDKWRKTSLRDHFVDSSMDFEEFRTGEYNELGDFVDGIYSSSVEQSENVQKVILERLGSVKIEAGSIPLKVKKTLSVDPTSTVINIAYSVQVRGEKSPEKLKDVDFIVELPFMFSGDPDKFKCIIDGDSVPFFEKKLLKCSKALFKDPHYGQKYEIELKGPTDSPVLYKHQITCHARTNNGYKDIYEGMNICLRYKLSEIIGKSMRFAINLG